MKTLSKIMLAGAVLLAVASCVALVKSNWAFLNMRLYDLARDTSERPCIESSYAALDFSHVVVHVPIQTF